MEIGTRDSHNDGNQEPGNLVPSFTSFHLPSQQRKNRDALCVADHVHTFQIKYIAPNKMKKEKSTGCGWKKTRNIAIFITNFLAS